MTLRNFMAMETDSIKLRVGTQVIPSEEFAVYCEAEFERRLNSGEDFDIAAYREAMELVMTKLTLLEAEEIA
jgi:hypothetical protein